MKRAFPLQPVAELSAIRLEEATRRLGELIGAEQTADERLRLLEQYRREYQARFLAAAEKGLSPGDWHNYRRFLARLDEAIEQAKRQLHESTVRLAAGKQRWLDARSRVKAMATLAARHAAALARFDARQAQKETDEHAARGSQHALHADVLDRE